MRVVRIFTRESGESAVEIRQVPMTGEARPMSATFNCSAIFFRETPEGHVQDYHNAPRRQLIFLTSGILELEASDGKRTICRPGDLIFAEDMKGKGHITRSLRDVRGFVHVSMPDDFDMSAWPLLKS
jgi:quercetin dioxygenase-like cupin family protein